MALSLCDLASSWTSSSDSRASIHGSVFSSVPLVRTHICFYPHTGASLLPRGQVYVASKVVFMPSPLDGGPPLEALGLPPNSGVSRPLHAPSVPTPSGVSDIRPLLVIGVFPQAGHSLPPFQKSRGPSGSTVSVELRPALSATALPKGGEDSREAVEGVLSSEKTGAERPYAPYQARAGSYGALGSYRSPSDLPVKTRVRLDVGAELADDTTQWFGTPPKRSMALPVEHLRFPWRRHARSGITPAELLSRESLRPDLMRVRRMYEAGLVDEASLVLDVLTSEGGGLTYQIPDAIPWDRTLAYSIGEDTHVDLMAEFLFDRVPGVPRRFMLSEVAELYVSPRPYAYLKAGVALQKSAGSLMRLHAIAVSPHAWATYRQCAEDDGRFFRSVSFEPGITAKDFPELHEAVREALPSLGVHALLPYALKHFGYACADPYHPAHSDLEQNFEREWAWSLGNAFMAEVRVNGRVFVQPIGVLASLERVASEIPAVPLHPLEQKSQHTMWSFTSVLSLMHRACQVTERTHRLWTDYTTGDRSAFILYDLRGDAFVAKTASSQPPSMPTGSGAGVGSN